MRSALLLAALLLTTFAGVGAAQDDGAAPVFPAAGSPDTLRSNLWVAQALAAAVADRVVAALPPAPARVSLAPTRDHDGDDLFLQAANRLLTDRGYSVYLDESQLPGRPGTTVAPPESDVQVRFRYERVDLNYPRVGRRFGFWRRWVDRELDLAMIVRVLDTADGRVLMDERVSRSFGDRVPAGKLSEIESAAYPFTSADVSESGWRRIIEELVVVGALTGMVAVYFANAGG